MTIFKQDEVGEYFQLVTNLPLNIEYKVFYEQKI